MYKYLWKNRRFGKTSLKEECISGQDKRATYRPPMMKCMHESNHHGDQKKRRCGDCIHVRFMYHERILSATRYVYNVTLHYWQAIDEQCYRVAEEIVDNVA